MHTELHNNAGLPAKQPYSGSPWFYNGSEVLDLNDPEIVDWMLVELYAGGFLRGQAAGLLRSDGNLVNTGGNPVVHIVVDKEVANTAVSDLNPLPPDTYYLVVRHRNHLPVRTKYPIKFADYQGEAVVNLSFDAGNCFSNQDYTSTVQIGSTWCLRAGDVNSDGQVKVNGANNDQNALVNDPALNGLLSSVLQDQYKTQDVNMDGLLKQSGPKNDLDFLANKVLGGSLSMVYKAQL
ncbi:hypothetical protein EXU57_21540 [Segetibacter sp. 3557_3]|uniref:hypothetical protein n=1 Tax=Segetibacter sp. 3557_3 TaxID=2547429 RepID=UPI0010590A0B|nr:hypothetical protein [Segetibacter sp. 3557_3]TDH20699.1 hypothetical protein EXU57_21540 [Segetibacter sp. 3557_3]